MVVNAIGHTPRFSIYRSLPESDPATSKTEETYLSRELDTQDATPSAFRYADMAQ